MSRWFLQIGFCDKRLFCFCFGLRLFFFWLLLTFSFATNPNEVITQRRPDIFRLQMFRFFFSTNFYLAISVIVSCIIVSCVFISVFFLLPLYCVYTVHPTTVSVPPSLSACLSVSLSLSQLLLIIHKNISMLLLYVLIC